MWTLCSLLGIKEPHFWIVMKNQSVAINLHLLVILLSFSKNNSISFNYDFQLFLSLLHMSPITFELQVLLFDPAVLKV